MENGGSPDECRAAGPRHFQTFDQPYTPACAWFEKDKLRSSLLRARLAERRTRYLAACPIQSADGATPLGVVYAGFLRLDGDEPPRAKILERVNGVAKDISAIIK
ncbi:hypothetical protein [Methylobacterium variabile]|uniref:hypothetical protein n=1 Tax=Methylobacterium variabile TaxID=298794 RepID=UPI000AF7D3DD|nr:hypothetical protein [Methylobacterium variabile]